MFIKDNIKKFNYATFFFLPQKEESHAIISEAIFKLQEGTDEGTN